MDERDYSQTVVARAVGVDQAAVSHWLKGKNEPKDDNLERLVSFLNVQREWLVEGTGPRESKGVVKTSDFSGIPEAIMTDLATLGHYARHSKAMRDVIYNLAKVIRQK